MKNIKRIIKVLVLSGITAVVLYLLFGKTSSYQSVYLVPHDALLIAHSRDVSESIKTIEDSKIWDYLKTNRNLGEVQQRVEHIDSTLSKKRFLIRLLAARKIQISLHPTQTGTGILAIIDLKKAGYIKKLDKILPKVTGRAYSISSRTYLNETITEMLSLENSEIYYLTVLKGKLLFSFTHSIIEKAIEQQNNMLLGRDLQFIEVNKHLSGKGPVNVIIPVKNWETQTDNPFKGKNELLNETFAGTSYLGILLNINDGKQLEIKTFANLNDTSRTFGNILLNSGDGKTEIQEVSPQRAASMLSLTFDNFDLFYDNLYASFPKAQQEHIDELFITSTKRLKIDIRKNFFNWIDNEIGFLQTQPSNPGKRNEFALVLKAKKEKQARKNLDYINEQIRKNTPIKFRSITYKDFEIQYLSAGPVLKTLFGKLIEKLEKPYYTIIGKYVIFSNHPQTLKNIIDDYLTKGTLAYDTEYYNFRKYYRGNSPVFTFVNTELLYHNLQYMVSDKLWQGISKNKDYIVCFNNIGLEVKADDGLLNANIIADFVPRTAVEKPVIYQQINRKTVSPILETTPVTAHQLPLKADTLEQFQAKIIIRNLDNKNQRDYYQNNNLKFEVELKHGLKHGTYKEYYENGEAKIKGRYRDDQRTGTWKYFNREGKILLEKSF